MAETSEFERIGNITHRMAADLASSDKSARGVESAFSGLFQKLLGAEFIGGIARQMVTNSRAYLAVQQSLSGENLHRLRLAQREIQLTSELNFQERLRRVTSGLTRETAAAQAADLRRQIELLQKQKMVAAELAELSRLQVGFVSMMLTMGAGMWANARQFNQSLIEANSSWQHRDRLIRQTLVTTAQLGISFDDITRSAAALVHYGMDTADTFETNLRLVAQMEQGLGVSVSESARLASIVERQLKGSFESVSHVIAQIVDDTALAGDEAARLATNISTALGRLRPGMSVASLPDVVRLVGRYESALKEVGGQSGAFQQLLTQLTSPEGLTGAGALNVSPEFLATTKGVQSVMDRFAQYGEMLVGQSQGWERQMRLQALAQIFNTTADNANQMLIAVKRANETQIGQISTQERWRQQLAATNSGVTRLVNSIIGLLQGAMYPFVFVIGALANKLADALEYILKFKEVVYAIGIGLAVATVAATASLWGLVRALWGVVVSSTAATAATGTASAARVALGVSSPLGEIFRKFGAMWSTVPAGTALYRARSALGLATVGETLRAHLPTLTSFLRGSVAGLSRIGLMLVRGLTMLFSPFALLAAGLTWIGYLVAKIYSINKQSREDTLAANRILMTGQEALESRKRAQLYSAARYGEASDVASVYKHLATMAGGLFPELEKDPRARKAKQQAWLDEQLGAAQVDISKAMMTRTLFTPMVERTPADIKRDEDMKGVSEKMLKVNEDQKAILIQRAKMQQEQLQEEAQERAKLRGWMPSFYWDFYSRLGEK